MNFNKLGIVVLSAGAIFMATSCNKTQTLKYDDAFYWVQKHYKKTGKPATISEEKIVADFSKTKGETSFKQYIRSMVENSIPASYMNPITFSLESDDNLVGSMELTKEEIKLQTTPEEGFTPMLPFAYLNETQFQSMFIGAKDFSKFTISNNSLTATVTQTSKTGTTYYTWKFDSEGAYKSITFKAKNLVDPGMQGTANGYVTLSFTY